MKGSLYKLPLEERQQLLEKINWLTPEEMAELDKKPPEELTLEEIASLFFCNRYQEPLTGMICPSLSDKDDFVRVDVQSAKPSDMWLLCIEGENKGASYAVPRQSGADIGRCDENDIVLSDPSVSHFHCSLQCTGFPSRSWSVYAVSANGLLCDGKMVPTDSSQELHVGSRLTIGRDVFVFSDSPDSIPEKVSP